MDEQAAFYWTCDFCPATGYGVEALDQHRSQCTARERWLGALRQQRLERQQLHSPAYEPQPPAGETGLGGPP